MYQTALISDIDFETVSAAGYNWSYSKARYVPPGDKKGIEAVGTAAYAEHHTTEVLSLAYHIPGQGMAVWLPGCPPPVALFEHIARGGFIRATGSLFEFYMWNECCVKKLGWPPLPLPQMMDVAADARAYGFPSGLGLLAQLLNAPIKKSDVGKRLIRKFSVPQTPNKKQPSIWIDPATDPEGPLFVDYNIDDVRAQMCVADRIPRLSPDEFETWQLDQKINVRGVAVDVEGVQQCIKVVEAVKLAGNAELWALSGQTIKTVDETKKMCLWLESLGCIMPKTPPSKKFPKGQYSLKADYVEAKISEGGLHPHALKALELRAALSSANIKKLYAMHRHMTRDNRLHGILLYYGANRTGRWAGRAVQPQNMSAYEIVDQRTGETVKDVEPVLQLIATGNVEAIRATYGDPLDVVCGCLRGLLVAAVDKEFICSDFSAIEAVVLAMLSGEQWRIDVFNDHGKIYEASASKITGIPLQEFFDHKEQTGKHHPMRKKVGKVAELASGYGGWIGAWKNFGAADMFANDEEIKQAVIKWRNENPAIVEFWGGQWRKHPHRWEFTPELYGVEGAAISACLHPGTAFTVRDVTYVVQNDVLYCRLPSGRFLTYQQPRLTNSTCRYSKKPIKQLSFMGWNSDQKRGPVGWQRIETYGPKLVENIVQAVSRDILAFAVKNLEAAGYPVVFHVHDEIISEVLKGFGSVDDFERIMSIMPPWAAWWPVFARGGYRARRYRK